MRGVRERPTCRDCRDPIPSGVDGWQTELAFRRCRDCLLLLYLMLRHLGRGHEEALEVLRETDDAEPIRLAWRSLVGGGQPNGASPEADR